MMSRFYVLFLFLLAMTVPAGASVDDGSYYCAEQIAFDLNYDGEVDVLDVISLLGCVLEITTCARNITTGMG